MSRWTRWLGSFGREPEPASTQLSDERSSPSVKTCDKVVSHSREFVAILVPKVARSTLLRVMTESHADRFDAEMLKLRLPRPYVSEKLEHYFKFAFVRDPWSRTVSCYLSKVADPPNERVLALIEPYEGVEPGMSFQAFVRWLVSPHAEDPVADRHWASQHLFLTTPDGQLAVDFVGRYESLEADFARICERIGVETPTLPVVNSRFHYLDESDSARDPDYYLDYYTPELAELVAQRYARDIEIFGFEDPTATTRDEREGSPGAFPPPEAR